MKKFNVEVSVLMRLMFQRWHWWNVLSEQ